MNPNSDAPVPTALPTREQCDAIIDFVQQHGRARHREFGKHFSSVDYVAGAMAVFFALGWNARIPAGWIFGRLGGGDPFPMEPKP